MHPPGGNDRLLFERWGNVSVQARSGPAGGPAREGASVDIDVRPEAWSSGTVPPNCSFAAYVSCLTAGVERGELAGDRCPSVCRSPVKLTRPNHPHVRIFFMSADASKEATAAEGPSRLHESSAGGRFALVCEMGHSLRYGVRRSRKPAYVGDSDLP